MKSLTTDSSSEKPTVSLPSAENNLVFRSFDLSTVVPSSEELRDFYHSELCALAHDNVDCYEVDEVIEGLKRFMAERISKAIKEYSQHVSESMKSVLSKLDDQSNAGRTE
jgi:hypothetical protein